MCQVSKSNKLLSFEQVARADLIGLIYATAFGRMKYSHSNTEPRMLG